MGYVPKLIRVSTHVHFANFNGILSFYQYRKDSIQSINLYSIRSVEYF